MRIIFLLLFATVALAQEPVLKKQELAAVKGSILVPEGWFFKEDADEGVSIYQITREKTGEEGAPFTVGLIITVTPKVKERVGKPASEYVADLLPSSPEEPGGKELTQTNEGSLKVFRTEYVIESEPSNVRLVNLAKANDATDTLYFVTWQSPETEDESLKDLREKILSSLTVDPAF
jgi:hypothetical protein